MHTIKATKVATSYSVMPMSSPRKQILQISSEFRCFFCMLMRGMKCEDRTLIYGTNRCERAGQTSLYKMWMRMQKQLH